MNDDQQILSDVRILFMDRMEKALAEAMSQVKQAERLYKESSAEMRNSNPGINITCDFNEVWSGICNAQGSAKMLRLHLEQGHEHTS